MGINGFSTCDKRVIGTYRIPGTRRSVPVRREIAPLLIGFAAEFHRLVEPIDSGTLDDWGYACRPVRGRLIPSFHAGGLALDLNALRHRLGARGTFSPRQAALIRALCRKYGLRWGGDYRRRPDEMHVEVILPRAAALALVKRLQSRPTPAAKPVAKGWPVLRLGMLNNAHVRVAQTHLKKANLYIGKIDGDFGDNTKKSVQALQKRHRLTQDGVVGHTTWLALRRYP